MVLQNKFKARASRRYNAARGGASDARGRGRGRGSFRGRDTSAFPSLNPDDGDDDDDDEQGTEGEIGEGSSSDENKGKYSRRKLESNAWRYREEEVDPHADGEEEPEVDLSGLLARVAKLDSNRTTKALSSEKAAESSLQADVQDIDQSLIYLLDRQRERDKSSSTSSSLRDQLSAKAVGGGLSASEIKLIQMEGKKMLQERESQRKNYARAQMFKSQQSRVKSIDIGDRRRASEDNKDQAKIKTKVREKIINLNALYDDDEERSPSAAGDIDAFLQELGTASVSSSQEGTTLLETKQHAALHTTDDPSQRKEHEDFLDSIF